jgi:cytochrome P450
LKSRDGLRSFRRRRCRARIEGKCALKSLLRRWPKLTLAVGEQEIKGRKRLGPKAIERLPVAPDRQ